MATGLAGASLAGADLVATGLAATGLAATGRAEAALAATGLAAALTGAALLVPGLTMAGLGTAILADPAVAGAALVPALASSTGFAVALLAIFTATFVFGADPRTGANAVPVFEEEFCDLVLYSAALTTAILLAVFAATVFVAPGRLAATAWSCWSLPWHLLLNAAAPDHYLSLPKLAGHCKLNALFTGNTAGSGATID